jgi:hypothetical protein
MVKISSDLLNWHTWRHVVYRHVGRVRKQLRHVDLIKNYNVGNVYTDN